MGVALFRGSIAGILTQLFHLYQPYKNITTSHSSDRRGASQIIDTMAREQGIFSLWSGFGMSMILVINPAINMYCYEYIRHYLSNLLNRKSSAIDFFAGLVSKAIATVICYPLIYISIITAASNNTSNENGNGRATDLIVNAYKKRVLKDFIKG